jgi:hypothetical protein
MLTQKGRAEKKQLFASLKKGKRQPARKSTTDKKERIANSRLQVTMQKGEMKSMMVMMMSENQLC